MSDALKTVNKRVTAQTVQATPDQVENNAGGFVFSIDELSRAKRFLILGSEKSFYQSGATLSLQNADNLIVLANKNSKALVDLIVEISVAGRAPKQNPALFALAVAASHGTAEEKRYALSKLPEVARTSTALFLFVTYVTQFRGWGRALKNAVAAWYTSKDVDTLAYQMVKYQNREGWAHKDLFSLSHPKFEGAEFKGLGEWLLRGDDTNVPRYVEGFLAAKDAEEGDLIEIIKAYKLGWEMVPNDKRSVAVWETILLHGNMPLGALLRQLPTLTRVGVLKPFSEALKAVQARLTDAGQIEKARIHPIAILTALKTYSSGHSVQGSSTWTPVAQITEALDKAFYLAFKNVEATGKNWLLGLDVSGSMGGAYNSVLSAREISAALALVIASTEPNTHTIGFTGDAEDRWGYYSRKKVEKAGPGKYSKAVTVLNITPGQRLDDVLNTISGLPFGSTDCALPVLYAIENNLEVHVFVVITDNETYAGSIHPFQALKMYRDKTGIAAKMIVLATTATEFSIADPKDPNSLDIAGFDAAVPALISGFVSGE